MYSPQINHFLQEGKLNVEGLLPRVEALRDLRFVFEPDFGLPALPTEPGLLLIRGPRQYGKSTWLELKIKETISTFGPGTAFYINGDELKDFEDLARAIKELLPLFSKGAPIKRLFIDEITAVKSWEMTFKRLADQGFFKDVLVVSTGSQAADLRRGFERLPGRKGKLSRTNYIFTPISFKEFEAKCGSVFGANIVTAYLLSGGCPIACNELAVRGHIPEFIVTMIRDWMQGECLSSGRDRASLLAVLEVLVRCGGNQVGQTKLSRDAGLANNTVAAGYIALLGDLLTIAPCGVWDSSRRVIVRREPSKLHFINSLAAISWHPERIRTIEQFNSMPNTEKSKFWEWLVAQEIFRRRALAGFEIPEQLAFYHDSERELDFVLDSNHFIEVKLGSANPLEFRWFSQIFSKGRLEIISERAFETQQMAGIPMKDFLRQQ